MPSVFPFNAVQYAKHPPLTDVSTLVAPPYDVLDAAAKQRLLDRDARNIVAIDLPHTPAKELGPPQAYAGAAEKYRAWLKDGTLRRSPEPAIFAYRQTTKGTSGTMSQRCGMACCVETVPFGPREGGGILPHEETFSGPKEDRLALMKATGAQMSPIFGLHADDSGAATRLVHRIMAESKPDFRADMGDGVLHEVWTIGDPAVIADYQEALAGEDVFIADGHHRYNTALMYLKGLESQAPLPGAHPARRCMMVLVGMSDPGLAIWPTHRVLGGMKDYTLEKFIDACKGKFTFKVAGMNIADLEEKMAETERHAGGRNVLGVLDTATGRCFVAMLAQEDPLKARFPDKPAAWRGLDVAMIQHVIVEQVCQPALNGGQPVTWAFPHTIKEVQEIAKGGETGAGGGKAFKPQLAIIVRPTPLQAVKDVSRANQLMPQKSTFFYPKLATGLFVNPLQPG